MLLCLADYLVPILAPRIFGSNKWTTEQQRRFHEICSNLVKTRRRAVGWWKRLFTLKEEKPKMYFMTMIVSLAAVAWVGQQVHNLLLTYLIGKSLGKYSAHPGQFNWNSVCSCLLSSRQ